MTVVKIAGEEKKTIGYIQEPFLGGILGGLVLDVD
jgi:hypothetical protein